MRFLLALVGFALLTGSSLAVVDTHQDADATALHAAQAVQPQAHWTVLRESLQPWANDVSRRDVRFTGGAGPAWVVELVAPGDSTWANYSAVVVINAFTGKISGASVLATNPG